MRRSGVAVLVMCVVLSLAGVPARAGLIDLAVGVYGGVNAPAEAGSSAGSIVGAKVRLLPPVPMVGAEAYYARFGTDNAASVWKGDGVRLDFDGEGFDVWGADLLIGGVRGLPGFKWYGIAGVNFVKFSKDGGSERRPGGELGLGLEIVPPALGLSLEGRGTLMFVGLGDEPSPKIATLTVGVNYYF
jgi:hypothetical protein